MVVRAFIHRILYYLSFVHLEQYGIFGFQEIGTSEYEKYSYIAV